MRKNLLVLLPFLLFIYLLNAQQKLGIINKNDILSYNNLKKIGNYNKDSVYVLFSEKTVKIREIKPEEKILKLWKNDSLTQHEVTIYSFDKIHYEMLKNQISFKRHTERPQFFAVKLKLSEFEINHLANQYFVKWIFYNPPQIHELNTPGVYNHRVNTLNPYFPVKKGLTGRGVRIGEWDGGTVGNHIDYNGRLTIGKTGTQNSHATHVAGTVFGAGSLNPLYLGMAPESHIICWDFYGDIPVEMDTNKNKFNYQLTQNSYGYWSSNCTSFANYDGTSTEMDILSRKYTDLLHVFAAGNSRGMNCISGGYGTILSGFQSAKNTISVAAVTHLDGDANFSSCGPTKDGRFKPEISAVGVNVVSTQNGNLYGASSGTSMACPGASGTLAVLYQQFLEKHSYFPPNFLAKNIISNSADDIGNVGPDFRYGFGRINAQKASKLIENQQWKIDSVGNGTTKYDTIRIPAGLHQLKVMLTWNDPESNPMQSVILNNDLDLYVIDTLGNTVRPWWCNPANPSSLAIRKRDSLNNIEQVTIDNPASGTYIIAVNGFSVSGNQTYSISYWKQEKGLKVTYPNGNETMLPPSSSFVAQNILWDNHGVTGNINIHLSTNAGATWTQIASNIPATNKYYTWQNLNDSVQTGKALIRIENGTISDESDSVFNIVKMTSSITSTICDSQVYLKWRRVAKAKAYRVFMLRNSKMEQIATTTDSNFLIKNLNNGVAYWFSISAILNDGGEGRRTIAVSFTPNNSVKPPLVTIQPIKLEACVSNLIFNKSTASSPTALTKTWEYSYNNKQNWSSVNELNDSIVLRNFFKKHEYWLRRKYVNVCEAPVYSNEVLIKTDSTIYFKFRNKDTTVCHSSIIADSVLAYSFHSPTYQWFKDSSNIDKILPNEKSRFFDSTLKNELKLFVKATNFCGTFSTKNSNPNPLLNGVNHYQLFPTPKINFMDSITTCIGETITINPTLSGGKPSQNKLFMVFDDTTVQKFTYQRKVNHNQIVIFKLTDNCYPDTITKIFKIKTYKPLEVDLKNDSTICYQSEAKLNTYAKGGNGNYQYTWNDIGIGSSNRTEILTQTKRYVVTLTDNCTEKTVKDSVLITVLPALSLKINAEDTICQGGTINFSTIKSGGFTNSHSIVWNNTNLSGFSPTFNPLKSDFYRATLSDGCSPIVKDSVWVIVRDSLKFTVKQFDSLCHLKPITLEANSSGGINGQRKIEWTNIGLTGHNVNYTPNSSIEINVKLSDGCSSFEPTTNLSLKLYLPLKVNTINDTNTCYGKSLSLTSSFKDGKTNTQFARWDNINSNTIWVDSFVSKSYRYYVKDGCNDSVSKVLNVSVSPQLSLSPTSFHKCSYQDFTPTINHNVLSGRNPQITWNDNALSGFNPTFKNSSTQQYIATISDGCSDNNQFTITVNVTDFSSNLITLEKVINKTVFIKNSPNINHTNSQIFWDLNLTGIPTQEYMNYTFPQYGKYKICRVLTDTIGCANTICLDIDNQDPAGFNQFKINIFPNPGDNLINLELNQLAKDVELKIIDMTGKVILIENWNYHPFELYSINTTELSSGAYYIQVKVNGEAFIYKWVKGV